MPRHRTIAPQAVVVPDGVEESRDILRASSALNSKTPSPFGVSIKTPDGHLQLMYVSRAAALDRSRERGLQGGVQPGWYALAQPGAFEVLVNRLQHVVLPQWYALSGEDAFSMALEVDGTDTHQRRVFCDASAVGSVSFTGFVERRRKSPRAPNVRKNVIRPFVFEKVSAVEGATHGRCDVGKILLKVKAGIVKHDTPVKVSNRSYKYLSTSISEKIVAKEGRSLQASKTAKTESYESRLSTYVVERKRDVPELWITIFVRERSWLHSRLIIDDHDRPVTYMRFRQLVNKTENKTENITEDVQPARKRPRIKEQLVIDDDVQPVLPGEVIDLT